MHAVVVRKENSHTSHYTANQRFAKTGNSCRSELKARGGPTTRRGYRLNQSLGSAPAARTRHAVKTVPSEIQGNVKVDIPTLSPDVPVHTGHELPTLRRALEAEIGV